MVERSISSRGTIYFNRQTTKPSVSKGKVSQKKKSLNWLAMVKLVLIIGLTFTFAFLVTQSSVFKHISSDSTNSTNVRKGIAIVSGGSNIDVTSQLTEAELKPDEATDSAQAKEVADDRALILKNYLSKKNSPLTDSAEDFIEAADLYGIDWRLLVAISGVESTFGKHIPSNSYNGWGWGIYGGKVTRFASWRDGIFTISKGLKDKYISRGLTNPYQINSIYSASSTWGSRVSYFLKEIDTFAATSNLQASVDQSFNLELSRNLEDTDINSIKS